MRYAGPEVRRRRRLRLMGLAAAVWLLWATVLSDHSIYRLWRLGSERGRQQNELTRIRQEVRLREAQLNDSRALRELGEHILRENSGMVGPGEIVYRVQAKDTVPSP
jgi:cell division protein FtsB